MAESELVPLERELPVTDTLQLAASMFQSNKCNVGWDFAQPHNLHAFGRCPWFGKKVTKGSLHHLPQSVICIPAHFMVAHRDTFQQGNLITLEGPSGNTWKVRATGKPILHSGWRAFAHDHDLHEGDELFFTLTQPLHFVVVLLNSRGAVKECAITATNTGKYAVASVRYPYEYVHRPRKRKGRKIAPTFQEEFVYAVPSAATIASRCKTTARERFGGENSFPNRLRLSHDIKQWECREEKDGREVVTILDSDDDENKRMLDHVKLSFGSAQEQGYRMNTIQRPVAHMKQQGDHVHPWSNTAAPMAVEDQRTVATQTASAHEVLGHGEESKAAENVYPETDAELNVNQVPVWRDEDPIMWNKEDKETHLPRLVKSLHVFELQSTPETNLCQEMLQSHAIPATPLAVEHKSVQIVDPLTEKAERLPLATKGLEVITSGGDNLFATLQSIVDMPVIADTIAQADKNKECPVAPASAATDHEVITCQEPEAKEIIMEPQSTAAAKVSKRNELQMARSRQSVIPGSSKTSTTACVLKSKRMQVAKLHRARTLRAAQAMTKKLRGPSFVAVMKSCNVYSDFTMDIPAEFGKKSRLPATEARVTLVCDEVPTMCKAIWIGTNPEKPKLDADAWMEFSRSHFLEEGDVCVFELFNRVTIRIGIHILRVVALSRCLLPLHWTQHYTVVHQDAHQQSCPGATPLPLRSDDACSDDVLNS